MDNILILHGAIVASSLTYFFKFSEKDNSFFESNYEQLKDIKRRITGEIAEEISRLGTPIPSVLIATNGTQSVDYIEGVANPLKGEKFKNWLDGYLSREFTFLDHYSEFKKIYNRWNSTWKVLKLYSMIIACVEAINLAICFFWMNKCVEVTDQASVVELTGFLCTGQTKDSLMVSGGIALLLVLIGFFFIIYMDKLQNKLVNYKDVYNGV